MPLRLLINRQAPALLSSFISLNAPKTHEVWRWIHIRYQKIKTAQLRTYSFR